MNQGKFKIVHLSQSFEPYIAYFPCNDPSNRFLSKNEAEQHIIHGNCNSTLQHIIIEEEKDNDWIVYIQNKL